MTERELIEELLMKFAALVTEIFEDEETRDGMAPESYEAYLKVLVEYRGLGYHVKGNTLEMEIQMYLIRLGL